MSDTLVFEKIVELFDSKKIPYKAFDHAHVHTSYDASKIRGVNISLGAKALVLVADKNPILVVDPGDKKVEKPTILSLI